MKRHLSLAVGALALLVPSVAMAAEGLPVTTLAGGIGLSWLICVGVSVANPRIGSAITGLMALGVSLYLGLQHGETSGLLCDVNAEVSCSAVLQSQYSTLFGIPIAFFGSGFYAAVIAGGVMAHLQPAAYRTAPRILLGASAFSVLYSIFLAWASKQVGAWCPFCISMYGFNAILLLGSVLWLRSAPTQSVPPAEGEDGSKAAPEEDRSLMTMVGSGAVIFLAAALMTSGSGSPDGASMSSTDLSGLFEATAGDLLLDGTEPSLGASDAPYQVVEFADFECPYCGIVAPKLKELIEDNDDIMLRYKHYPISNICNENVDRPAHTNACAASMTSECANQQQRFWEINRLIFKNQSNLTAADLRFMAQQVGLDMDAYQACVDNPLTEAAVRADVAHATQVGVTGTPSLFLKGVTGDEWIRVRGGPDELMALIEAHRAGIPFPETPPASRH